jgi:hypothetical protein
MVCPHSGRESGGQRRGIERRQFLLSAVAIGGTSALAACMDREESSPEPGQSNESGNTTQNGSHSENGTDGGDTGDETDSPDESGPVPFEYRNLPKEQSQHAWNRYLDTNEHGLPKPPRHRVLVLADYAGTGVPTDSERREMEQSLETLESAYEWSNEGLLFTVSYSPSYFERFAESLPEEVDLPEPAALAEFESPVLDEYDVCIHLGSDHAQAVLGAEEALFGNIREINGVTVENTVEGILDKRDRRTGFIGAGLPADHQDVEGIPDSKPVDEDAPLYMGFQSEHTVAEDHPYHGETEATYVRNQNSEFGAMIKEGPFEGGTTQHVSKIRLDLDDWYGSHSLEDRVKRMFAPTADVDTIGEVGQNDQTSTIFPGMDIFEEAIEEEGFVSHGLKMIRNSEEGLRPLLRRDFNTTDNDHAGVHFVSLQETISDFIATRALMNGAGFRASHDSIETRKNNGILEFIEVTNRANFLVPPRALRSLPRPSGDVQ